MYLCEEKLRGRLVNADIKVMYLGQNLKYILRQKNLKIAELSRATQISVQTLNNWLANQSPRKIEQVYRVCVFLGISMEELVFSKLPAKSDPLRAIVDDEIYAGKFEVVLRRLKIEGD